MAWWDGAARTAEFDSAGVLQASRLVSLTMGARDALSIAYNPVSKTHGLVGVRDLVINGQLANRNRVVAAELDGNGVKVGGETVGPALT